MEQAEPLSATTRWKSPALWILLALAGLAMLVGVWLWRKPRSPEREETQSAGAVPADPRLAYEGKFQNIHPSVGYVGDAECILCHKSIGEKYRKHPMGRSLSPITSETIDEHVPASFEADGFVYEAERRGERLYHIEKKLSLDKRELFRREAEIRYVVGSGSSGRSYLVEREGFLTQSPLTWYAEDNVWALSPGYREFNHHFERQITSGCLVCHSNGVKAASDANNRYLEPIFTGHAIGCERCHGPGELHVNAHRSAQEIDYPDCTIVNPSHLSSAVRNAVCEQCHLQGLERVLRPGRDWFDYRPGMPLHDFWSVYTRTEELDPSKRFVSHAEQMVESRCYKMSNGDLSCISCHDPHGVPSPNEKAQIYRTACLSCHSEGQPSCKEVLEVRRQKNDDCTACHMPRIDSDDITHTATTDHRIPPRGVKAREPSEQLEPDELPIVHFHRDQLADIASRDRDLGIALIRLGGADPHWASLGEAYLAPAIRDWPGDIQAREALAQSVLNQGRPEAALRELETVLESKPNREFALLRAALVTDMLPHRADRSGRYWERLVEVNPHASEHRFRFAQNLIQRGKGESAVDSLAISLSLNPASTRTRRLLIEALLRVERKDEAEKQFSIYKQLRGSDVEEVERLFAQP